MGGAISTIKDAAGAIKDVITLLSSLNAKLNAANQRMTSPPGLPARKPTSSYWLDNPPFPRLVNIKNDIPATADIVIVGSGVTGAASAKSILELTSRADPPPRVVVLEARELCGGATGRNGGHIKTTPHEVFSRLKGKIGTEAAVEVTRFQMKHLALLLRLGQQYPLGEVRQVETVDLYIDKGDWEKAAAEVDELKSVMDEFQAEVWSGVEARKRFDVNEHVEGAISYQAGALWPYRLVTSIWNDLLETYPNLAISTSTPVEAVLASSSPSHPYEIRFTGGKIQARHVLHATNAFATQLVPGLKGRLTGVLAHMSAQKPGDAFPKYGGNRSWSIMYSPGYDYITQRPGQDGRGDLLIGGGLFRSKDEGLDQIGRWDDGGMDAFPLMHIRGCMPSVFEPNWGMGGGLVKAWTGIVGVTGDFMPLVGRIPEQEHKAEVEGLAGSGQWVAAGFCGDGMVWAWLCGTATAVMICGREEEELDEVLGRPGGKLRDWFPKELGLEGGRLGRADLKHLAAEFS